MYYYTGVEELVFSKRYFTKHMKKKWCLKRLNIFKTECCQYSNCKTGEADKEDKGKDVAEYYKSIGGLSIIVALAAPFILCLFLKASLELNWQCLVINEDISLWFSFWGSYAGVFVSIVVAVITLRLTVRLDKSNRELADMQTRIAVVSDIPKMECEELILYSFSEEGFDEEIYCQFGDYQKYILHLVMTPAFPPYFEVGLKNIIITVNGNNGRQIERIDLQESDYIIRNNKDFYVDIKLPDQYENLIGMLYTSYLSDTYAWEYQSKISTIDVGVECKNVLLEGNCTDISFCMSLAVKSKECNARQGVEFEIINREFKKVGL